MEIWLPPGLQVEGAGPTLRQLQWLIKGSNPQTRQCGRCRAPAEAPPSSPFLGVKAKSEVKSSKRVGDGKEGREGRGLRRRPGDMREEDQGRGGTRMEDGPSGNGNSLPGRVTGRRRAEVAADAGGGLSAEADQH